MLDMMKYILRMIDDGDKKRVATRKPKPKKKTSAKTTVGWQYNSKTMRYEPILGNSKRHNF